MRVLNLLFLPTNWVKIAEDVLFEEVKTQTVHKTFLVTLNGATINKIHENIFVE